MQEGWREEYPTDSERFHFYKVRINGVLQLVKEPASRYGADMVTLESLRKEFNLCFGLNHPGIPRYYAFEGSKLYEEFIEGESLRQLIDRHDKRLEDPKFVINVCRELLSILEYLHGHGIVHLDIKPENILLTTIGCRTRLIDFGSAVNAENGTVAGYTPGYCAPEQIEGKINTYTDFYLLGKVIEELVGDSEHAKKWRKFINKAKASNPDERFGSFKEAYHLIPVRSAKKTGNIWNIVAILTLLTAVIAGIIIYNPFHPTESEEDSGKTLTHESAQQRTEVPKDTVAYRQETQATIEHGIPLPTATIGKTMEIKSGGSMELKLRNEISRQISSIYSRRVGYIASHPRVDSLGWLTHESDQEFQTANRAAYDEAVAYINQLVKSNPAYKDLIEIEGMKTTEAVAVTHYNRFYESNRKKVREMGY